MRKALGDGVRMMVDVNQKLDVLGNIRQAQLLEDLDLVWYEEPVLADDYAGLRRGRALRSTSRSPPARTTTRASSSAS